MSNELLTREGFSPVQELKLDENENMIADLTDRKVSYCSFVPASLEEKKALYNIQNAPAYRIKDCINMEILFKDVYVESVTIVNENTGERATCPRIILIDMENNGYQCVSFGIYNAVKRLISIFGEPTWEEGIKLRIKQISKGKDKNPLTLELVE